MPRQTPMDSRQNGRSSPKQADCLDALSSSCQVHQKDIPTLLGSDVGIPEGKPEIRLSMGRRDFVAIWKAGESRSPEE